MFGTTEKALAAVCAGGLVMLVPYYYLLPLLALFFFPLFYPTIVLYLVAFALVYFVGFVLLKSLRVPLWATRAAAAVVAVALVGYAAMTLPRPANARTVKTVAALEAQEKYAAATLMPVRSVALIHIDNLPEAFDDCGSFCTSLLLSGMAEEVQVASRRPDPHMRAMGYRLSHRAGCVVEDAAWKPRFDGTKGKPPETGDFVRALQQRFGHCISEVPAHPIDADLVFTDAMAPPRDAPRILNIEWRFPAPQVEDTQTLVTRSGAVLLRRYNIFAWRVRAPLTLQPVSGSSGVPDGPGYWSRTEYGTRDRGPFLDGWWGIVANADAIYAKAAAFRF